MRGATSGRVEDEDAFGEDAAEDDGDARDGTRANDGRGGGRKRARASGDARASTSGQEKRAKANAGRGKEGNATRGRNGRGGARLRWTPELHREFINAVNQLGGLELATPKGIMHIMAMSGMTIQHIEIACELRKKTSATNPWIANRLNMGDPSHVSRHVNTMSNIKD